MKLLKTLPCLPLLMILPLLSAISLRAQEINENNFVQYTVAQGLSNNTATGLAQDSTGYMWIATASGLNRFNGSNFIQYHSNDDSNSLPAEALSGLTWIDKNRLAVFNTAGVHIINTQNGVTRNLYIPYADKRYQYKFNGVMSVRGNASGDIFVLTRSGFYHFDKNYELVFRYDHYSKKDVSTEDFIYGRYLLNLDEHFLAVVALDGISYYDFKLRQFKQMVPADFPLWKKFFDDPTARCVFFQQKPGRFFIINVGSDSLIYIDLKKNIKTITRLPFTSLNPEFDYRSQVTTINDSLLYITGNTSGFYKMILNRETGQINFSTTKYFPEYYCKDMIVDKNHGLWIATNKGVFREDKRHSYVQQGNIPAALDILFPRITFDDVVVAQDKIYAGVRGNGGLMEFEKDGLRFIRQINFSKDTKGANNVFALIDADDDNILVGTNGPLFLLNKKSGQIKQVPLESWHQGEWIADIYRGRDNKIWVITDKIYLYDPAKQTASLVSPKGTDMLDIQWPNSLGGDAQGKIWVSGHGVTRYDPTAKVFDRFVDSFPFIKIPDRQINTFICDNQDNLWLNVNNNGLVCYNINTKTFRHFTRNDGLPDNNIASMIVVRNKLWIASYSGLACMDLNTHEISNFGKEDGFPNQPIAKGAKFFYDSALNRLYIGFANTIVCFDPGIAYQWSPLPRLFFESVVAGDQKKHMLPTDDISSDWSKNEITVTIGSINFFTSSSQRFAYRIVNDDNTPWQQLGTQNSFSILNLSPGYHRIQVKIFSADNRWPSQIKELHFNMMPPFWEKPWFLILAAIAVLILLYLLLAWRIKVIRRKEKEKTNLQKLKAEEYKNQFELEQISNYFSSSLADKKSVDDVLWDVAKNLIGRMNYADCMIYLWNKDKTRMVQKASFGPKGDPLSISNKIFDVLPGQGVVGYVTELKEPLLITDTSKDNRYRVDDIVRMSEVCVPIIHNNELIGIIDSEHPQANYFNERDIKILMTIATLTGNKIKQIESEQSLEIKQNEISSINQHLAEAQLSALQTQMNPHFIFNCLNSIKGMILDNEPQKASRYLSKFAQMIRITLSQSKEIFTTLHENVDHLQNYLVMEKLRFDDSFTFQIIVDDNIDKEEILIPTLMIQPLAENAIWHGLMHKQEEKKLMIRFSRRGNMIFCIIEDNGIGIRRSQELKEINKPSHQSVGLNNLRNRIRIMNEKYQTGCTLEITDLNDTDKDRNGTRVVLRFNIINHKTSI